MQTDVTIIGAGPAALAAIPQLLNSGVAGADIVWIDPQFKVGDFGSILSVGSSVPGNTSVENYQKVFNKFVPFEFVTHGQKPHALDGKS